MDFESAIQDDRAVSPVIGVILMVAITVILAAVIGTFVLGMSDQVGSDTPRASFDMSVGNSGSTVTITHETGDTIDGANVVITSTQAFDQATGSGSTWEAIDGGSDVEISAGSSISISHSTGDFTGDTVRVVYQSPESDSSTTLSKKEFS